SIIRRPRPMRALSSGGGGDRLPGMKRPLRVKALLVILAALCAWIFWPLQPLDLIVSEQTTHFLVPMKSDGTVDYRRLMDRCLSQGSLSRSVGRENNAAMPLLEALGPSMLEPRGRKAAHEALGLEALPEQGKYLIHIEDQARDSGFKPWLDKITE